MTPFPQPISEQVVLITGASAGIGAALAQALAHRWTGIRLVLAARNQDKLTRVADLCSKAGADVITVPTDMSDVAQVQALAQAAIATFGRVDVLVNNAGYGQMGPIELIPPSAVQRQFQVNVLGTIALIQALTPVMRNQGGGKIINISSIAGRIAFPLGGLYSASKFALEALSDTLRRELDPFNIRVSIIEPGPVSTEFFEVVNREVDYAIPDGGANSPYRAAFENLENLDQLTRRQAWTSEQVASVIVKAIGATYPRSRYVAATAGDFLVFMMTKLLPTRLVDLFWQKFYGIDLVAKDWNNQRKAG
ncbi:SDR family oxidoreductase [Myxacorys almedinensis]|uniref:SDR family NAD(P)-dependent oxidoreductase n=1 Tax=Myxacorys almedinensis A TaxID=2690445 RepID=A0A8J8CK16_9CYAN|nr:SDR family oxidoreductase [Myxacorys almedinensis]NDJ19129.1 SDR family NAD(P)-dependent oxidoreductase [Myxacorys almedinensis A]